MWKSLNFFISIILDSKDNSEAYSNNEKTIVSFFTINLLLLNPLYGFINQELI